MTAIQQVPYVIDPKIKGVEQLSYVDEPINSERVRDFYDSIGRAQIKFINLKEGEKSDPKKGFKTFLDYFRTHLYEEENTRFKLNAQTNVVVLSKRYYEKDGFTLSFCAKTFKILDFKHHRVKDQAEQVEQVEQEPTIGQVDTSEEDLYKDILSIETLKEGTNVIVVIQDGKIITVRTSGTHDAESSYDIEDTHYDLFFKTLDEQQFGLSKFFEISQTTPEVKYCFNFLMKLNFTPFPTFTDNEIHLISAYKINDMKTAHELFKIQLEELPQTDFEEKQQELEEFINTELTASYIEYFDTKDVISLFHNIGSGLIKGPEVYDIKPEMDLKSIIVDIISKQDALKGEKGLIIKYSDGRYQEIINFKYQMIIDSRCGCSMVVTPGNKRKLFYELFIKLLFMKDDEKERATLFQNFYTYYDGVERLDGKGGQYSELFKTFYTGIHEYSSKAFDLYKRHRIQKVLPHERSEIYNEIPRCFKYKGTNIVNIIHEYYQSKRVEDTPSANHTNKFKIQLTDVVETIVFETILRAKYDSFVSDDPQIKAKDIYGDIYGKIMTPL